MIDPALAWIAAAATALVLTRSAVLKLADFARFRGAVDDYRIVPGGLGLVVAVLLPTAEAGASAMLLVPATRPWGGMLALAVLGVVSAAVAINLARGRSEIECGCGGPGQRISAALLGRNLALAAVAALALLPPDGRALAPLDAALVAAGALMWAGLYLVADRLLATRDLFRQRGALP